MNLTNFCEWWSIKLSTSANDQLFKSTEYKLIIWIKGEISAGVSVALLVVVIVNAYKYGEMKGYYFLSCYNY